MATDLLTTPAGAPWPALLPAPLQLLGWLDEQTRAHRTNADTLRLLGGLRWLVLAEVDRTAPDPPPKPPDLL